MQNCILTNLRIFQVWLRQQVILKLDHSVFKLFSVGPSTWKLALYVLARLYLPCIVEYAYDSCILQLFYL